MFPRINFNAFVTWLLPSFLRKRSHIAWLLVLIKPGRDVYTWLRRYRDNTLWRATINGQVNRLRQALRQHFASNQIQIVHPTNLQQRVYIYQASEQQVPTYIYRWFEGQRPYIYQASELTLTFDFIVVIPPGLIPRADEIYAFVNYYRPAGRSFAIFSPSYPGGLRVRP
jgi:hypothetical protein